MDTPQPRPVSIALGLIGLLLVAGCAHRNSAALPAPSDDTIQLPHQDAGTPQPSQRLFDSPEDAAAVLKDGVQTKDRRLLIYIFGPAGKQLVLSGDRVQENNDMESFANLMSEQLRVDHPTANKAVLYIGAQNWPFPIPVVKSGDKWFFDTVAGEDELLSRRIGENELGAISVCRAYVAAQKEYAGKPRDGGITQYAQHFMSTAGRNDGLYWAAEPGEELSPMGPLVAQAHQEGYGQKPPNGKKQPYHGYFFHILTAQGDAAPGGKMSYIADGRLTKGFAFIAYPDKWGSSGIMTFIVNQDGKVFEKNLGEQTRASAGTITEYNPDSTWQLVKD